MRRISLLVMMAVILMSLTACKFPFGCDVVPPNEETFTKSNLAIPEKPEVDVYIDASLSMLGYTTIPSDNSYRELPDELMDVGSSMGGIHFYSFGKDVVPLQGSDYRKFINPSAYTELENSIKTVIDNAEPEHLTVILTDLFETDAAWSVISSKIQEKYFSNNCGVAVLGLKSPFNGTVYDVGLDAAKYDFNSGNEPAMYRPVYMLVMGPDVHVNSFLKRCKEKNVGGNTINIVKLSSNLMDGEPADGASMESIIENNAVEIDSIQLPEKSHALQYKINDSEDETEIVRTFKYVPDKYGCNIDITKVKPVIKVRYYDKSEEMWKDFDGKPITVAFNPSEEDGAGEGMYDLHITFKAAEALQQDTVNDVMITLVPEYDGLILPEWISQWNLPSGVAVGSGFDGSKTINLLRTVGSLKDSVLSASQPSLINLEVYFDVR